MPRRIQIHDADELPPNTVDVRHDAPYRNPFRPGKAGVADADHSINAYCHWLRGGVTMGGRFVFHRARKDLKGMDLACDCPITGDSGERFPCHGDVLLYVANNEKMPAGLSPLAAADYAHNEDSK